MYFLNGVGEGEKNNFSCLLVLGLFCDALMCFVLLFLFFHDVLLLFVLGFLLSIHSFPILILLRLWLDEKTHSFFFSSPAKVEIRANSKQKHPVKLFFSVQNEISGEKIQCREEGNAPKKVDFAPKPAGSDEKGRFWGRNHREGMKRKIGLCYRFCHAMK